MSGPLDITIATPTCSLCKQLVEIVPLENLERERALAPEAVKDRRRGNKDHTKCDMHVRCPRCAPPWMIVCLNFTVRER